ncbi:hypothetical protein A4G19_04740 [Pasteurellaceae bacterium Macca]|nr:hypothetical protein [Pasteurellaceae bacterium Macca]
MPPIASDNKGINTLIVPVIIKYPTTAINSTTLLSYISQLIPKPIQSNKAEFANTILPITDIKNINQKFRPLIEFNEGATSGQIF